MEVQGVLSLDLFISKLWKALKFYADDVLNKEELEKIFIANDNKKSKGI